MLTHEHTGSVSVHVGISMQCMMQCDIILDAQDNVSKSELSNRNHHQNFRLKRDLFRLKLNESRANISVLTRTLSSVLIFGTDLCVNVSIWVC